MPAYRLIIITLQNSQEDKYSWEFFYAGAAGAAGYNTFSVKSRPLAAELTPATSLLPN
jgi:hypothetical protein